MRLIDADDVKTWIKAICDNEECRQEAEAEKDCQYCRVDFVVKVLDSRPTVDAEPVRRGHWVHENAWYPPTCSMCGGSPKTPGFIGNVEFYEKYFHRCPNCGAKMDEVTGNGNQ